LVREIIDKSKYFVVFNKDFPMICNRCSRCLRVVATAICLCIGAEGVATGVRLYIADPRPPHREAPVPATSRVVVTATITASSSATTFWTARAPAAKAPASRIGGPSAPRAGGRSVSEDLPSALGAGSLRRLQRSGTLNSKMSEALYDFWQA
jgi:hypothetical protein